MFFSDSLDDVYKAKRKKVEQYIKEMPASEIDPVRKEDICKAIAHQFGTPELPQFNAGGVIERDAEELKEDDPYAYVNYYFPYTGNASLFRLYANTRPMIPPPPTFEVVDGKLRRRYRIEKQRLDKVDEKVQEDIDTINKYIPEIHRLVPIYDQQLREHVDFVFAQRLKQINENKEASAKASQSKFALRKRTTEDTKLIVPLERKIAPIAPAKVQPKGSNSVQEFILEMNQYDDIIATMSSMIKVMERSPDVFKPMGEEPLRTVLLVALNGLYEGDATGETFNGKGKTDILIRRGDRNVFIAECLMWRGKDYLRKKMNGQLFQYAMWRDSKLALVIFNRGGDFTKAIATMKETVREHPQCIKEITEWRHESGGRYLFKRHDDPARQFHLTAIAFNVPSTADFEEEPVVFDGPDK